MWKHILLPSEGKKLQDLFLQKLIIALVLVAGHAAGEERSLENAQLLGWDCLCTLIPAQSLLEQKPGACSEPGSLLTLALSLTLFRCCKSVFLFIYLVQEHLSFAQSCESAKGLVRCQVNCAAAPQSSGQQ